MAPILPYVTEEIYRHRVRLSAVADQSIHLSRWPTPDKTLEDDWIESAGDALIEAITAVRRFKTEHSLALSAELAQLQLATPDAKLAEALRGGLADIKSITRARQIEISEQLDSSLTVVKAEGTIVAALASVS